MVNLNKVFPRLSIRRKLVIAFVAAALLPLGITSLLGTRETLRQMRTAAADMLDYRLRIAEAHTARSLSAAQNHVVYLARFVFAPLVVGGGDTPANLARAQDFASRLLDTEPALYQVRIFRADGEQLLTARSRMSNWPGRGDDESGLYYAWRAEALKPDEKLVIPIELRGVSGPNDKGATIAALAIILPLHDSDGEPLGVVVGELQAAALFEHINRDTLAPVSVVGLVDREGLFLYHSQRKRHWSSLLASREAETLASDFPQLVVRTMLSGGSGHMVAPDGTLISYRPLQLDDASAAALTLYYAVPRETIVAPAQRFVMQMAGGGGVVVMLVLGGAILAAFQFTGPILRLRAAAQTLTRTGNAPTIQVDTNDELEDLARDFRTMAHTIADSRQQLEQLVAERTQLLEQTRADFAELLKHSADAIVSTDASGKVAAWNRGAERLFGYAAERAIGERLETLIGPRDVGAERELSFLERELNMAGEVVNYATERFARDGALIPVTLTATRPPDAHHVARGTSYIFRDARLQRKIEEQLRRSERLAAVSVLTAGLAHEINTPLAIIGNRIECMQRDAQEAGDRGALLRDLGVLAAHVIRLSEVTTGLLRFARDDDQSVMRVDVRACVEHVTGLYERTLVMRKLRLTRDIDGRALWMTTNATAIQTVLINLLTNAADATPAGGEVTISLRYDAENASAELRVSDNGPGIPVSLRERVFEPFFTTKSEGHGTGLGLTVCRSIVERLGGRLTLELPPQGGASFAVTLPNVTERE
ncbi:MAG: ATP-binding protein [Gemmatimonadota bacterium]